jgi:hypothetical protein
MTSMPADLEVTPLDAHDPRAPVATARHHEDLARRAATTAIRAPRAATDRHDRAHAASDRRVLHAVMTVIVTREHPGPDRSTRTVAVRVPNAATTARAVTVVRASRHAAPGPIRETARATRVPVVPQVGVRRVRAT